MSSSSHLVQLLLPKETGNRQQIPQKWFENLLQELTAQFGGVTSFVRAPGQGLWNSGGHVEHDNIAVIEVMSEELDRSFWRDLRRRLEQELSQEKIVVRAHKITRL